MPTLAIRRSITSAIAGVVITLAIAWGTAAYINPYECTLVIQSFDSPDRLDTYERCSWCGVRRSWHLWEGWPLDSTSRDFDPEISRNRLTSRHPAGHTSPRHAGKHWGTMIDSLDDVSGSSPAPILQEARGWPWLAVECSMEQNPPNFTWTADAGFILPFPSQPTDLSLRVLPYRPIWPGLIANTALFAILFACLTTTARAGRRALRRRRGLCPICTYDLSGNTTPGCPECGHGRAIA
jgi:hypothetical protein